MGKVFFIILALIFSIIIYRKKGIKKLPWFFAGILFFPGTITILTTPATTFPRLMIYVILFATITQEKDWYGQFKRFPLKIPLIIVFVSLLLVGIVDDRLDLYLRIYRPVTTFMESFLVLFITFVYVRTRGDLMYLIDKLLIIFVVMGLYGILNIVTGQSEYYRFISDTYNIMDTANLNMTEGRSRFRIASFTNNPIYYGFLICIIMLLGIFKSSFNLGRKEKKYLVIFLVLYSVNLLLVNSRTPLVSFILGFALFSFFATKATQKIKIFLVGLMLLIAGSVLFPDKFKIVDETLSTFSSSGSELEGSSIEMREVQLAASLVIFYQSPIFGHGFKYIQEDLGFSGDIEERRSDSDLKGFESYAYALLIEQGLVGIFANLYFFISCFIWLIRQRRHASLIGRKLIVLSFAMFTAFIFFIFGTGALGSFMFFMCIMGLIFKTILLSDNLTVENS